MKHKRDRMFQRLKNLGCGIAGGGCGYRFPPAGFA